MLALQAASRWSIRQEALEAPVLNLDARGDRIYVAAGQSTKSLRGTGLYVQLTPKLPAAQ